MLIDTASLSPSDDPNHTYQTYCGLDTMVTFEVWEVLQAQLPHANPIYRFTRALQAPYLEIMQRGMAVDHALREKKVGALKERQNHLQKLLDTFSVAVWGKELNPRSPLQLCQFFYGAMCLPEVWLFQKGVKKLSTNREALEKLAVYMHAQPLVACILALRDVAKQLEVLCGAFDSDGRFRAGYNIVGTETGRPSSSSNAFGTGTNAQNISPSLRDIFIADPGKKMAVIDLEQVEARDVGFFCGCLFGDWTFLDACEEGDLHTTNARKIWPELGWTDDKAENRKIADRIFYRDFSYRDMAKRGSHLSNYSGTASTAARSLKVPLQLMVDFQNRYIKGPQAAYPCIPRWWQWTAEQLQTTGKLRNPFGRVRHFFGRPDDATTLREAIAHLPQSTTADRMNLAMLKVWKAYPQIQLLGQTYDSITFQYDETIDEDALLGSILQMIEIELFSPSGRRYVVPGEAKTGWNWGYAGKNNPGGLTKWKKGQQDTRSRPVLCPSRLAEVIALSKEALMLKGLRHV